jgi:hypothetical protein
MPKRSQTSGTGARLRASLLVGCGVF